MYWLQNLDSFLIYDRNPIKINQSSCLKYPDKSLNHENATLHLNYCSVSLLMRSKVTTFFVTLDHLTACQELKSKTFQTHFYGNSHTGAKMNTFSLKLPHLSRK